jgi:4-hydroxy-tetrahydrodipicolinate synthase
MIRPLVITAVPTAFREDGTVDLDGVAAIARHAIEGGVDSLLVNGTTGEFPALTREERASIVRTAVEVAGPERVIAHIGGSSAWEAVGFTADALANGAVALAAITPYFLPATQSGVHDYFDQIRKAAPNVELYAYLFPDRTSVHVLPEDTAQLVADFDLVGVKVSIAGVGYVTDLIAALPNGRRVFSGNDGLQVAVAQAGGAGVISGVSSALPAPFVAMADAIASGDVVAQEGLQLRVDRAVTTLGPSIAGLKLAIQQQGIIERASCRMAIDPPSPELAARIASLVADFAISTSAQPTT